MCTFLLGRDILGPGTVVFAANRDEDPARPSAPPARLVPGRPIVGGRDLRAGGTWLALRGGGSPAAAALLNRRPSEDAPPPRRTRGELPLALLLADDPDGLAHERLASGDYGPCTLLWLSPGGCWALSRPGGHSRPQPIGRGWHAITHADLDDRDEPRTAWLLDQLDGFAPATLEAAWSRLGDLLASHGSEGGPPVCLHDGRMRTVSAARGALGPGPVRYEHAEGRPCEHGFVRMEEWLSMPITNEEGTR